MSTSTDSSDDREAITVRVHHAGDSDIRVAYEAMRRKIATQIRRRGVWLGTRGGPTIDTFLTLRGRW